MNQKPIKGQAIDDYLVDAFSDANFANEEISNWVCQFCRK